MDFALVDDRDVIDIAVILFTVGGDFSLENDVLVHILEEEEKEQQPVVCWGGSRPGKAPNLVERHRVMYLHLLYNDFWGPTPVYNDIYFKKFFKLPIGLFDEIVERIALHDPSFTQKRDQLRREVVLMGNMQNLEQHNLLQHDLMVERWER